MNVRKKYDMATALYIAGVCSGFVGAKDYVSEELFRTKSGDFFLHAEGGALTRYAEGNNLHGYTSGDWIFPLTSEEAYLWAERNMTSDKRKLLFGSRPSYNNGQISGRSKKRITDPSVTLWDKE